MALKLLCMRLIKLIQSRRSDGIAVIHLKRERLNLREWRLNYGTNSTRIVGIMTGNRGLRWGHEDGEWWTDLGVFSKTNWGLRNNRRSSLGKRIGRQELLYFAWISEWDLWTFTEITEGKVLEEKFMRLQELYFENTNYCMPAWHQYVDFSILMNPLNRNFPSSSMHHIHINL